MVNGQFKRTLIILLRRNETIHLAEDYQRRRPEHYSGLEYLRA